MADILKYVSLANLTAYDAKIKEHIATADAAVKSNLEGQVTVVANALDSEIARAKAAEQVNATAASNAQTAVDTLAGKVGTVEDGKTVMGIIEQIQADAYDDTEIRGLISDLDTNKADKTQVATDIAAAVKVETDARVEAVAGVQGEVDALEQTVASNKTAIEGTVSTLEAKVDANETDIEGKMTALTERVAANETAVGTTLPNAIEAEKARAEGVEADLQTQINTIMNNPDTEGVINSINEFTQYIEDHGEIAEGFRTDIDANADDIETLGGRMTTAEGKITALEGEMDTAQSDIETLRAAIADGGSVEQRIADLETASATHALKTEVEAVSTALTEYKDAHASDYTNAQIDAAIKVVADDVANLGSTYATDEELATAIANEVTRSDAAYAAKSLETTVAEHKADTVAHITAEERTLWNTIGDLEECTTAEIEALFTA